MLTRQPTVEDMIWTSEFLFRSQNGKYPLWLEPEPDWHWINKNGPIFSKTFQRNINMILRNTWSQKLPGRVGVDGILAAVSGTEAFWAIPFTIPPPEMAAGRMAEADSKCKCHAEFSRKLFLEQTPRQANPTQLKCGFFFFFFDWPWVLPGGMWEKWWLGKELAKFAPSPPIWLTSNSSALFATLLKTGDLHIGNCSIIFYTINR